MPSARIQKQNELKLSKDQLEKEEKEAAVAESEAKSEAESKTRPKFKTVQTARKSVSIRMGNYEFPDGTHSFYDESIDYTNLYTTDGISLADPKVRRFPPRHLWKQMNILCVPSFMLPPETDESRAIMHKRRIKCIASAFKHPYDTSKWAEKFFPSMDIMIQWFKVKKDIREERTAHVLKKLDKTEEVKKHMKRLNEYFKLSEKKELRRGGCDKELGPDQDEVYAAQNELKAEKEAHVITLKQLLC